VRYRLHLVFPSVDGDVGDAVCTTLQRTAALRTQLELEVMLLEICSLDVVARVPIAMAVVRFVAANGHEQDFWLIIAAFHDLGANCDGG